MELEELKANWNVLNERLEKSEMLNKRIIKEMITGRTQSAYERLFWYDMFGGIVALGLCILFPVLFIIDKLVLHPLSFALLEGCIALGLLMQLFFCFILARFNMEKKKICELGRLALTYKLWVKRNFTIGSVIGIIILIAFLFIEKERLAGNWPIRLGATLLFVSVIIYYQKCFYQKNIRVIEKGLEELKEFEEEPVSE